MFALLELFDLFAFADGASAVTNPESQTSTRSLLLFCAIVVNTGLLTEWPDSPGFDPRAFAAVAAGQIAAALLLIALMHRLRPIGPDIPRRRWAETYARSVGPLAFTAIGATLVSGGVRSYVPDQVLFAATLGVFGGVMWFFGLAALVHRARAPF